MRRGSAYPFDRRWRAVSGGGVHPAGDSAHRGQGSVLLRWHLAADRCRGGDGFHRTGAGTFDVAPVRRPVEKGQPEGRFARRLRALNADGSSGPTATLATCRTKENTSE